MKDQAIPYKIYLQEEELPKAWYNLRADMKNKPAPLLQPAPLKPMPAAAHMSTSSCSWGPAR